MATPEGACPVCWACMQSVKGAVNQDIIFVLEDNDEAWDELAELIQENNPSPDAQILRAFFVLEWTCKHTIPQLMHTAGREDVLHESGVLVLIRSIDGLTYIDTYLKSMLMKLSSYKLALALRKRAGYQQQVQLLDRPERLIKKCLECTAILRTALRIQDLKSTLHKLGSLMGMAFIETSTAPGDVQQYLRRLLSVTMEHPYGERTSRSDLPHQ